MNVKTFVDTNVLIYAYDVDAGRKREIAKGFCGNCDHSVA
jgi:predicted nucleic acid-binding protein